MMKIRFNMLGILLTAVGTQSAISATTATLNITGTIEPAACNVEVTKHADFGTLKRAGLTAQNGVIALPNVTAGFKITCDGNASTGITLHSSAQGLSFTGLNATSVKQNGGLTSGSNMLGSYTLTPKNIKVDGKGYDALVRSNSASNFVKLASNSPLELDNTQTLGWGTDKTSTAAKIVEGEFDVKAMLDESKLNNKDATKFTGSTVLTLVYN